jgi:hypothetical protein
MELADLWKEGNMSGDFAGLAIKRIQAAIVRHPELSGSILSGGLYVVSRDTCRIFWIVPISSRMTGHRVKSVESSGCRQPEHSGTILAKLRDRSG